MMQQTSNQTSPAGKAARAFSATTLAVCLLCLPGMLASARQQPDNANARRERTKRVTPLKTSDSSQGSRVTITSDGELNDYSAYRSGDRFVIVIPQAEGGGGGGRGRGFEGAQVTRRGKDLVYTFKLEPGASARVNQRFNRLDVQFTSTKPAAQATASATPAPTPRAQRTPPEIARLPTPTPAAQPRVDPRGASQSTQQIAAQQQQQTAATPEQSQSLPGLRTSVETSQAGASPTAEPSVAPTAAAEQLAQAQEPAAPISAVAPPQMAESASGFTLGATLVNNLPWIIAALLALGVGLLFVGRLGSRRGQPDTTSPAALMPPAPREAKAAPAAPKATTAVTTAAPTPTPTSKTPPPSNAAAVTTAAALGTSASSAPPASANLVPVAGPRGKKKKKKGKGKAGFEQGSATTTAKAEPPKAVERVEPGADAQPPAPEAVGAELSAPDATKAAVVVGSGAAALATRGEVETDAPAADSERVGIEVKNLLAGESYDESVIGATDAATRQLVTAELSAALSGRNAARIERARAAFRRHNYFDDAARDLQSAEAPGRRAAAAHTLSLVGDREATPHLVAALEDPSADVRRAAVEALAELRDPAAAGPLEALRWREQSRQLPRQLIMRAIELCAEPAGEVDDTEATLVRDATPKEVDETETTLVHGTTPEVATPAAAMPEVATGAAESKEIELAGPTVAVAEAYADREAAASEDADSETFSVSDLINDEAARPEIQTATGPHVEPPVEAAAPTVDLPAEDTTADDLTAGEDATVEAPALTFESPAVETPAGEGRAAGAGEIRGSAPGLEPTASRPQTSGAVEALDAAEVETGVVGEVVYTFDDAEAAAWAERRGASPQEPEEDLLAELDALEATAAGSRAGAQGVLDHFDTAPAYAAEAPTEEDWVEANFDDERTLSGVETQPAVAEVVAPLDEPVGPPLVVLSEADDEATQQAGAVKSVELHGGAAESQAKPAVSETPTSAIELYPAEESGIEPPFGRPAASASELDLASEETAAARGLAAVGDEATVLDAARPERGLSASLEEAGEISIIPKAIQLRLESEDSHERAQSVLALARLNTDEAFTQICAAFDDRADEVRAAAARALYEVTDDRAESFTRALREATPERRRNIGSALATSGLADDAVSQLTGESRDRTYDAFSLLFLMAKAGETVPLIKAIESHSDNEVRLAVVKLLALSGQQDVLPAFRRLAVRGSLPADVRAAVMEAIYQISSGSATPAPSGR